MSKLLDEKKRVVRPRDAATLVLLRRVRGKTCVLMGHLLQANHNLHGGLASD